VLLSEISREEDELRKRFIEMFDNLENRELKLAEICAVLDRGTFKYPNDMAEVVKELNGMIGSLAVTTAALDKGQDAMVAVRKDYERILKELRINQVDLFDSIKRVGASIVEPLVEIEGAEFPAAKAGIANFSRAIDKAKGMNNVPEVTNSTRASAKDAQLKIKELKDRLRAVKDAMDKMADIAVLIEKLKAIEAKLREQEDKENELLRKLIEDQINKLTNPKP
jgi:hypothetical protein